MLSDGVGTARDPERCAERVVRLVSDSFSARPRQWPVRKAMERLVEQVNDSLYKEGAYLDGTASMQATLAAVCVMGNRLRGLNVGDSRVLLMHGAEVERLSHDHVSMNGDGHDILTQAIGMGPHLSPHYFEKALSKDDLIVVTSDGLSKLMDDATLGQAARKYASAQSLVREVIENKKTTETDDLSLVIMRVEQLGPDLPEPQSPEEKTFPQPGKGREFDGHKLSHHIGGNNRVWLAEKEGGRFVIKFVPQEAETDDSGTIVARFAREAWNASRLHGEFFVPARLPQDGSAYYYIMDYVEAPSLRFVLKSRKLGIDEAIELGKFLCRAGQFLLGKELIHGDIKPDNVLVFRDGDDISFKMLDLGLASPVFTAASTSGTPTYLAPERFAGASVTERTEIFSIGVTLYETLTGRTPYGTFERFQVPHFGRVQRPSKWNPNIPPWLDCVILKCLRLQQADRFECYSELLFALEHPEQAPQDLGLEGPLLETNPLLFYKITTAVLLVLVVLLTSLILLWHH